MYLISIYFDGKTENLMQSLINKVAKATRNSYMTDGKIPPHITVLAFESKNEDRVIELLEENLESFKSGSLFFSSTGTFKGKVLYVEPVLNEYLHNMSAKLYDIYKDMEDVKFSPYYKPFGWIPHLSIGKHLDDGQLEDAFRVLVKHFAPMKGVVKRIGIAKTNPHRDIKVYEVHE